ncbi:hypothetical protein MMC13_004396 [Lambiella insularis]|nr:hypothetical protein [Lambiella insularis]
MAVQFFYPRRAESPLSVLPALLCISFAIIAIATISFVQLLKPFDKRPPPKGKAWRLPPGPRGLPVIGNLLLYSKGEAAARELAKYGEMTTTHLGSKLWVVLNSQRLAVELYNRKGSLTNGRPEYPVVGGLISRDMRSVLMQPEQWTEQRRIMHQLLSGTAMTRYQGYQDEESVRLLLGYSARPSQWYAYHHRYANSVVHRIAFGERPTENDAKVRALARAQQVFLMNGPPMNIFDCFPALAQLPNVLQWWRKKYEDLGQMTYDAYSAYWNPICDSIKAGKALPSFARDIVNGESKFTGGEDEAMYLTMQLVEAGSDTTRLALNIFVLAALTHPGVFMRARAEVDAICGEAERLPQFEDENDMAYICAVAKELFRWRPFLIWTPEHTLTEDLAFEGYLFPKGTGFVINQINVTQNPELVEEPETFKPERWLDGKQSDITNGLWQFGGGRRVCVGYRLAQKSLFINIARLVYCFDYEATASFDTKIDHFKEGEPFPVLPRIRSKKHADLITRAAEQLEVL